MFRDLSILDDVVLTQLFFGALRMAAAQARVRRTHHSVKSAAMGRGSFNQE
jgi:hypothetical protein